MAFCFDNKAVSEVNLASGCDMSDKNNIKSAGNLAVVDSLSAVVKASCATNGGKKRTLFYLVRHGQSVGNAKEIILGHTDLGLTELGIKQAECTAEALSTVAFDCIYSSDLLRAMQTAEPNARKHDLPIIPDIRLRELYCGDWEGKSVTEIAEQNYDMFFGQWRGVFGNFQMPNGESVPQLAQRICDCLADLGGRHLGQVVLCATHAAAIRAFWGKISGIEPALLGKTLPFPSNASYSLVEFDGEKFIPLKYSCDEHFAENNMRTVVI